MLGFKTLEEPPEHVMFMLAADRTSETAGDDIVTVYAP